MLESITLLIFIIALIVCLTTGFSIIYALVFGVFLFSFYAKLKGFTLKEIVKMLYTGAKKVKNILMVFVCIGCLTAVWRICGTIPYIVYYSAGLIRPEIFIFCAFALCGLLSYLTGSSFATAGTVGTICIMLGNAAGIPPLPLGGAIMSGCYFGDRCSPMSSSALLVAEVSGTNIYDNIKTMFKTGLIPLIISCVLYLLLRFDTAAVAQNNSLEIFNDSFILHWFCIIPALITLILCSFKINVKITMLISAAAGLIICLALQKLSLGYVLKTMLLGFHPENQPELARLLEGGGLASMVDVAIIVFLSSCFSGIFEGTELLSQIDHLLVKLSSLITKEGTYLFTAILTCMLACNQSLATILTNDLSLSYQPDRHLRAAWMENTVIVIAPLIPWNIASAVPLAILGVSSKSLLFAWYLYLLPVSLLVSGIASAIKKQQTQNT